jgi:hypothetical protein
VIVTERIERRLLTVLALFDCLQDFQLQEKDTTGDERRFAIRALLSFCFGFPPHFLKFRVKN